MCAFATLVAVLALLASADLRAQEALTSATPTGKPLVWDPEFTIPDHDPETQTVAFRLLPSFAESGDLPFFRDREGIVIPKAGADVAVEVLSEDAEFVLLVCSFPQPGPFNVGLPEVRSQYCTLRRAERQP